MENENKVLSPTGQPENPNSATQGEIVTEVKVEKKRCPNCQALLADNMRFCSECGISFNRICPYCNSTLQDGQAFCSLCGRKSDDFMQATSPIEQFNQNIMYGEKKGNKKKKVLSIIGIILAVALVVSYFVYQNIKVTTYKDNAQAFCSLVLTSAANLEDIGNEVQSEWYDYINNRWSIYDSIEEAVSTALINKSSEISTAKTQKSAIEILYSKLKKPVNDTDEIEDLCEAVKNLYYEYEEMYDCVTDPSGNFLSFKSNFSNCDSEILEAYKELDKLCDAFN